MDQLNSYIKELEEDVKIDELNLKEAALMLPARKAKWVSRLIIEKNNLNDLHKERTRLINDVVEEIKKELTLLSNNITEKVIQIKLNGVIKFLVPLSKTSKIGDNEIINILQYYELLNEFKSINGQVQI